ncbi:MAG TPA: hypothetical protein VFX47_02490 [Gammaproteobacteria bacterium]|nr:hypothetical protein [Gammaproteobacteria bacterium]
MDNRFIFTPDALAVGAAADRHTVHRPASCHLIGDIFLSPVRSVRNTGNKKPAQRYSLEKALEQVIEDTALAVFIERPQAEYQIGAEGNY